MIKTTENTWHIEIIVENSNRTGNQKSVYFYNFWILWVFVAENRFSSFLSISLNLSLELYVEILKVIFRMFILVVPCTTQFFQVSVLIRLPRCTTKIFFEEKLLLEAPEFLVNRFVEPFGCILFSFFH